MLPLTGWTEEESKCVYLLYHLWDLPNLLLLLLGLEALVFRSKPKLSCHGSYEGSKMSARQLIEQNIQALASSRGRNVMEVVVSN